MTQTAPSFSFETVRPEDVLLFRPTRLFAQTNAGLRRVVVAGGALRPLDASFAALDQNIPADEVTVDGKTLLASRSRTGPDGTPSLVRAVRLDQETQVGEALYPAGSLVCQVPSAGGDYVTRAYTPDEAEKITRELVRVDSRDNVLAPPGVNRDDVDLTIHLMRYAQRISNDPAVSAHIRDLAQTLAPTEAGPNRDRD